MAKTSQLQIRVSPRQKAMIARKARKARMHVSEWILAQVLPPARGEFEAYLEELRRRPERSSLVLAALNDFLDGLSAHDFVAATQEAPTTHDAFHLAYVAAMVEVAAHRKDRPAPEWTQRVGALEQPYFASELRALRAHLLRASPPPFRRRNIFIDASIGDRT